MNSQSPFGFSQQIGTGSLKNDNCLKYFSCQKGTSLEPAVELVTILEVELVTSGHLFKIFMTNLFTCCPDNYLDSR
jgi:hypothetical protein